MEGREARTQNGGWSEIADCALLRTMTGTRSSKSLHVPQSRGRVFGTCFAAAVAILLLFLYLKNGSFVGGPPSPEPQGSWRQVHQALGISPGISSTTHRKQTLLQPSSGRNLPLRLVDSGSNLEEKTYTLRDFDAALRSALGRPNKGDE